MARIGKPRGRSMTAASTPMRDLPRQRPLFFARGAECAYGWFFTPVPAIWPEVARILLGCVLVGTYLRLLPFAAVLFGPQGIGGHDSLARWPGWAGLAYEAFARYRVLHLFAAPWAAMALYGLLLASAVCFLLGVFPRWTGALAAGLHIVFTAHNPQLRAGWSWLLGPFVLYVAAANPTGRLSLPALVTRSRGEPPREHYLVPWGLRLLQVHVAMMYVAAGVERLDAPGWIHGEMVLRALVNAGYARLNFDWFALRPILVAIAYGVLVIEPIAAFLLWWPRAAKVLVPILIAMHVGIEVLIDAGYWQWLMCAGLVTFLPAARPRELAGRGGSAEARRAPEPAIAGAPPSDPTQARAAP